MADNIDQAISDAVKVLNEVFGDKEELSGAGGFRFLDLQEQIEVYTKEIDFDLFRNQFMSASEAIKKMRSSYLPAELVNDTPLNSDISDLSESITNDQAQFESFENTFMRMLGMPMSDDPYISAAVQTIKSIDPETGLTVVKDFIDIESEILDQRQISRDSRSYIIDDNVVNTLIENDTETLKGVLSRMGIDPAAVATGEEELGIVEQATDINIPNLSESQFIKFSYLLVPPIQDARISRCINEPEKIIAKPFSSTRNRMLNQKKLRPSLLETIIRIRRDRLSGTKAVLDLESGESASTVSVSIGDDSSSTELDSSSYGLIESLFIVRLASALAGLAKRYITTASEFSTNVEKTGKKQRDPNIDPDNRNPGTAPSEEDLEDAHKSQEQINLEHQQTIENSLLSLLVDSTGAIDLQEDTQRTSSIHDGHLSDAMLGIIQLPGKRIEKKLKEIEKNKKSGHRKGTEKAGSEINEIFGVSIGIGAIDIIVFTLALFTIPENYLIGLLSQEQFVIMQSNEFKDLLTGFSEKENSLDSINALTENIIAGYNKFIAIASGLATEQDIIGIVS